MQAALLDANPAVASRGTLEESRAHNADFRRRLLAAIDNILIAEEEAQRWYERKLIQVIDAHLAHQKMLLWQAWERHLRRGARGRIGHPRARWRSIAARARRTSRSVIRLTWPTSSATPRARTGRIQSATESIVKVPDVVAALHEVGTLYFNYKRELEDRIKANKLRRRDGAAALAIKDLPSYKRLRNALRRHGAKHFILWATYRDVIEDKAIETAFTQKMQDRCTRLIIEALRTAWKTCDEVATNARTDRLFKDERPKPSSGATSSGHPLRMWSWAPPTGEVRNRHRCTAWPTPEARRPAQEAGRILRARRGCRCRSMP